MGLPQYIASLRCDLSNDLYKLEQKMAKLSSDCLEERRKCEEAIAILKRKLKDMEGV